MTVQVDSGVCDSSSDGRGGICGILLFVVFACAALSVSVFTPVGDYLSKENISALVAQYGYWGPVVLVCVSLVAPVFFLPRWPVAWVAGLLYGIVWGTALATVASTLGALVHYVLARTTLAPAAQKAMSKFGMRPDSLSGKKLFYFFFFLRAFPLSNFIATNLLAGAMKVRPVIYVAATFLGMIPSSIMYASWGKVMKERTSSFSMVAVLSAVFIIMGFYLAQKRFVPWVKEIKAANGEKSEQV